MTTQNYLVIELNVVTNVCIWDGNTNTWQPPADATMLIQSTTPAMIWELNADKTDYVLTEQMGAGSIGFTWDGVVCITNEPKPKIPVQPVSIGTQVL
jgi:hypothetical protein